MRARAQTFGGTMADTTQDFDMDIPEPELEFGDPKPSTPEPSPAATPAAAGISAIRSYLPSSTSAP